LIPTKQAILSAYRRSAFLEAATRVFGECGFERATMDRIAREAGVAKGTIYLYYASKQSIYDAALAAGFAELDDRTRQAVDDAPTLRDVISAFISARAGYFFEHRDFFRLYVAAIASRITAVKPRASECQAMVDRQTRRLEQAITRAVARREVRRVEPAAAAQAIFDLTRGLVTRRMLSQPASGLAEDAAFLADLIWQGLERGKREKGKSKGKARRASLESRAASRESRSREAR
jgi:AcrR family transcriptional regulator